MNQLLARLAAPVALAVWTLTASPPVGAGQDVNAAQIRFVYPDAPETSNDPYPPVHDQKKVERQLRTVMVVSHGHRMTMAQYLRSIGFRPSTVVTIKVQADAAAVYLPRQ